ncbi:MAG: Spy/CpxP family protein refolding chaperone [Myxococcota bacterium]|nr:Spy/CpxP family protein refolding chaperone [Myxococcota bacterium]
MRRARRCGYEGYGLHTPWSGGHHHHDHHHRGHGHRRGRWMVHAALARLDATPAQERVIVGELDRLQERVTAARSSVTDTRPELGAALRGPTLDDAALGTILGRVDAATGEVRATAIEALRNVHAVLDDKQRATLAGMLDGGAGWWRSGPYR